MKNQAEVIAMEIVSEKNAEVIKGHKLYTREEVSELLNQIYFKIQDADFGPNESKRLNDAFEEIGNLKTEIATLNGELEEKQKELDGRTGFSSDDMTYIKSAIKEALTQEIYWDSVISIELSNDNQIQVTVDSHQVAEEVWITLKTTKLNKNER